MTWAYFDQKKKKKNDLSIVKYDICENKMSRWCIYITLWRLIRTLLAQKSPQALQRVLGPEGPRRIIGVHLELIPQWVHLRKTHSRLK